MLNEISAIAEEQEFIDEIVAIIHIQIKGKEEELPIPRKCDPDVLAASFVTKHKLRNTLSSTIANKIREQLNEHEKKRATTLTPSPKSSPAEANGSNFLSNLLSQKHSGSVPSKSGSQTGFSPKFQHSSSLSSQSFQRTAVATPGLILTPPSPSTTQSEPPSKLLATLNIRIGGTKEADLVILENSDPEQLARNFMSTHGLPESNLEALVGKISEIKETGGVGSESDDESDSGSDSDRSESVTEDTPDDISNYRSTSDLVFHNESDQIVKKAMTSAPPANKTVASASQRNSINSQPTAAVEPSRSDTKPPVRSLLSSMRQLSNVFTKKSSKNLTVPEPSAAEAAPGPILAPPTPSTTQSEPSSKLLATLNIRIGGTKEADLVILENSDPEQLARNFMSTHGLPESNLEALVGKISEIKVTGGVGSESDDESDSDSDSDGEKSTVIETTVSEERDPSVRCIVPPAQLPVTSVSHILPARTKSFLDSTNGQPMISAQSRKSFKLSIVFSDDMSEIISFHTTDALSEVAVDFIRKHTLSGLSVEKLTGWMQDMIVDGQVTRSHSIISNEPISSAALTRSNSIRRDSDASRHAYNAAKQNWSTDGGSVTSASSSRIFEASQQESIPFASAEHEWPRGREVARGVQPGAKRSTSANSSRLSGSSSLVTNAMVVGKSQQHSRSRSPGGKHGATFERLYKEAADSKLRYSKFKERLEKQQKRDLERGAREAKRGAFSTTVTGSRQRSQSAPRAGMNPGEVLFERDMERIKAREKQLAKMREANEAKESKDLTFHPDITPTASVVSCTRASVINGRAVDGVHAALYEAGVQRANKMKEEAARRKAIQDLPVERKPEISKRSIKLAEKRRNKMFHGAAVSTAPVPPKQACTVEQAPTEPVPREIAKMRIQISYDKWADLVIVEGLDPEDLVRNFVATHSLPESALMALGARVSEMTAASGSTDIRDSSRAPAKDRDVTERSRSLSKQIRSDASHSVSPSRTRGSRQQDQKTSNHTKQRSASVDATARSGKRATVFDYLYGQAREYGDQVRRKAAEEHGFSSNFSPRTKASRAREGDVAQEGVGEAASHRLYEIRQNKENAQKEMAEREFKRVMGRDPSKDKKLKPAELKGLLTRFEEETKKVQEKLSAAEAKIRLKEAGNTRQINTKSDLIAAKKRRSALREIFTVLLYTVDMAREKEGYSGHRESNQAAQGHPHFEYVEESKGRDWQVAKERGQDAYEMCPVRESAEGASYEHGITCAVDEGVSEHDSTSSEPAVPTNLMGRFNSARSSPPPPPPPHTSDNPVVSGNKYYFRAESLDKKKKVMSGPETVVTGVELFDLDEARSGSTSGVPPPPSLGQLLAHPRTSKRRPERKLDSSRADAMLLKPPALSDAVSLVLQACRPSFISEEEFIESFELVVDAGLTPPMTMLLTLPDQKSRPRSVKLSSEERELQSQCRKTPELCNGKRAVKLREKVAAVPTETRFAEYEKQRQKKFDDARFQATEELSKQITFQPEIITKKRKSRSRQNKRHATFSLDLSDHQAIEVGDTIVGANKG